MLVSLVVAILFYLDLQGPTRHFAQGHIWRDHLIRFSRKDVEMGQNKGKGVKIHEFYIEKNFQELQQKGEVLGGQTI